MKRIFSFWITYIVLALSVNAASAAELWFVCITHDKDTKVSSLTESLKKDYIAIASKNKDIQLILYYPNGTTPHIVRYNTKDANEKDYEEKIVSSLYGQPSQTIYSHVDLDSIGSIFNSMNVFSKDSINYSSVKIDFFASRQFLELGCGKSLIEKLYFALDIQRKIENKQELSFSVNCEGVELSDDSKYFGESNPDNFNNCVNIVNYNE